VGLIAREIERAGIPTVTLSVVREASVRSPAPRNVFVPFRLGQVFGEPGAAVQQRTILVEALAALLHMRAPGAILDLPYRWKRSIYRDPLAHA
jgi:D-proline reductase (dithiol) PrdB